MTSKNNAEKKILSISIAAYNIQSYIEQTLDSLICEEVMDKLEVLIIDDGSSDDTNKIASKYESRYPNCFKVITKENGGWGSTVNKGMEIATGKYFKLLDGDDFFETKNIKEFIEYLEKTDDDIVLSSYAMYNHEKQKIYAIKEYNLQERKSYNIEQIVSSCEIFMHGMTVKKTLIDLANIHIVDHCFFTDTQFVAELFANSKTVSYYKPYIYCYRVGLEGQSVSATGMLKHLGDNLKVASEMIDYKKNLNLSDIMEIWYDGKINFSITQEMYAYCFMEKKERLKKFDEVKKYINDNSIRFIPKSKEVEINIKTGYQFTSAIHFLFDIVRKMGEKMKIDLVQQTM